MASAAPEPVTTASSLPGVLAAVVPDLRRICRDPWGVIGSAAAWLVGAKVSVADVDFLTSARDAKALGERWHARLDNRYVPEGSNRFRSHFARFVFPGLPVEVMGKLEVHGADGWMPVKIDQLMTINCAGEGVPIPSMAEQIRILNYLDARRICNVSVCWNH